jgi:DNA repair protein RadC
MYEIRIVKTKPMVVSEDGTKVTKPEDVFEMLKPIRDHNQEHFIAITLNGAGAVIQSRVITVGLLNHSLVHPRETFRGAILDNAASIIIAHNHPSGQLEPSSNDIAITQQMKESGAILGIQVIDHIIVGKTGYLSFRERGLM